MVTFEEFKKLQDRLPPLPFSIIQKVIEKELCCPSADVFSEIQEIPKATASIAQVHEAVLKDGTPVMIKVQRPKIAHNPNRWFRRNGHR